MKYRWSHTVRRTDLSGNQLLCPKTLATFLFLETCDHVLGNEKFHRCSFLNTQIHGTQNKCLQIMFFNNPNKFFNFWFLKFVYLNVYSIAWIPVLVTFRVALHYVRPDNYHVFWSCDVVVELGLLDGTWLETCRDLYARFVEIGLICFVKSLQSWNRNNLFEEIYAWLERRLVFPNTGW